MTSLFSDAEQLHRGMFKLHAGNTYTHLYKAVLRDIRDLSRKILSEDVPEEELPFLRRKLTEDDAKRLDVEKILVKIYTGVLHLLMVVSEDDRKKTAIHLGIINSEADSIGNAFLLNILESPGSEALAVKRIAESLNGQA